MIAKRLPKFLLIGFVALALGYFLVFCDPPYMISFGLLLNAGLIFLLIIIQLGYLLAFAMNKQQRKIVSFIPLYIAALILLGSDLAFRHLDVQSEKNREYAEKVAQLLENELKTNHSAPHDFEHFCKDRKLPYTGMYYGLGNVKIEYSIHHNKKGFTLSYYDAGRMEVKTYDSGNKEWQSYTDAGAISFSMPEERSQDKIQKNYFLSPLGIKFLGVCPV